MRGKKIAQEGKSPNSRRKIPALKNRGRGTRIRSNILRPSRVSTQIGSCVFCPGHPPNKDYRWRCRSCEKFFSVRTGTIFEETRLPLRVWVYAFWKACSSKKGISALQLAREMEITHKSALFVLRRIRHGMGEENAPKLTGTIEADELFMGGKPRFAGQSKAGRGSNKYPILGVVQRGGDVRFHALERLTASVNSSQRTRT